MATIDTDGRLGMAIKEIARGMAEHGKDRIRMTVVIGKLEAVYEVRLLRTRARSKCRRVGGLLVVEPGRIR